MRQQSIPVDELVDLLAFEGGAALGSSIVEEAADRGLEDPLLLALQILVRPMDIKIPGPIGKDTVRFIPGHTVAGAWGPDPESKVMVIGKMPWGEEQSTSRIFSGPSGELWKEVVSRHGADISNWYMTNVCRFMPPRRAKQLKAGWLKECRWFLEQEIAIIKPEFILVLGTDAAKALFGKSATVSKLRGTQDLKYGDAQVVVTTHPSAVIQDPTQMEGLELDLVQFVGMVTGERKSYRKLCNYKALYTEDELAAVVDELIAEGRTRFAIDCEWGGLDGADVTRGELRYLQFSPAPYQAYAVVFTKEGLVPAFQPGNDAAIRQLSRLFNRPGVRICGHNFRADIKWTDKYGLDLHTEFMAGFDTMLGYHMLHPNQGWGYGLEQLSVRYTDCGRYEKPLETWLDARGYKKKDMRKFGYAFIPDDILLPYAMTDADVTFRCWDLIEEKLAAMKIGPHYGPYEYHGTQIETMLDLYFLSEHPVSEPILEVEQTGFLADTERLKHLVTFFAGKYETMVEALRNKLNWPEFNPRSIKQVREFLFGFCDGAALDEQGMPTKATKYMPEGSTCLFLTPVKTTGKPSRDWNRLSAYEKRFANPSTDSESLSILADAAPLAKELSQLRFVDQIIKNFLRAADAEEKEDEEAPEVFVDVHTGDDSHAFEPVFSTGLLGCVDLDGRVRTSISQLTDTGRWRSAAPNMMNLPKKQETELKQIFSPSVAELLATVGWTGLSEVILKEKGLLDPGYFTIRSCFMAAPGCVLVEADYVQAELNVLSKITGDKNLIAVLSDKARDIHAELALDAFGLPRCTPKEVKKLYPSKRDAAKKSVYGIIYQLGNAALVRQVRREGVPDFTMEQARVLGDTFFDLYPLTYDYIQDCKAAVGNPGYVESPFGRRRYFYPTSDESVRAGQERQAVNMPIQGTVAEALAIAMINLVNYRKYVDQSVDFRLLLPVHDAIMLEVPVAHLDRVVEDVLPLCMCRQAKVPHIGLELSIDTSVYRRWGEKLTKAEAVAEALASKTGGC